MKPNNLSNIVYNIHKASLNGGAVRIPPFLSNVIKVGLDDRQKPKDFEVKNSYKTEVGILMSGGLDSIACYLMAKLKYHKVRCFYYDIGQPYMEKELEKITQIVPDEELEIISDFSLSSKGSKYNWGEVIIPLRNLLLIIDASERITGGELYFGVVENEIMPTGYGDKGVDFLIEIRKILSNLPLPVELITPLDKMTKGEIVKWYLDNDYKKELHLTMSCLSPEAGHCGQCKSCFKKYIAFHLHDEELEINGDLNMEHIVEYVDRKGDYEEKYISEMNTSINLL